MNDCFVVKLREQAEEKVREYKALEREQSVLIMRCARLEEYIEKLNNFLEWEAQEK